MADEEQVVEQESELVTDEVLSDEVSEEVTEDSEPEVEETPEVDPFIARLGELGFEGVNDPDEARERLIEAYRSTQTQYEELQRNYETTRELAEYGRQYLEELRSKPKETEQKSEGPESFWKPPEYDPQWAERYGERDPETGEFRWKEGTPANVRTQAEEYQAYVADWADSLTRRPHEVLPKIIESVVQPMFDNYYETRRKQESEQTFVEQLRQENDWLYERDPRTNQVLFDRFSPEGQQVAQVLSELADAGVSDPKRQWNLAMKMLGRNRSEPAPVQSPAEKRETVRRNHLKKAASPSRGGSQPSREQQDERPRNVNNTPGQSLLQSLEEDGVLTF